METINYAPTQVTEDSLKKRYFYKLTTNLIGLLINLVTASIIPRGLGAAAYGNFSFLSEFFNQIVSFFESGTAVAFFSKLSQRPREVSLIQFYWYFATILSLTLLSFVVVIFAAELEDLLWPGQLALYIWLAAGLGLLTWHSQIVNHVVDAYGLTVSSEIARMQQKVLGLLLILLMFWANQFSLAEFFLYNYLILLFLCFAWWRVLKRAGLNLFPGIKLSLAQVRAYSQEFYHYAAPLISYALIGLLVGVLDRWLLQKFAGSVEQGFYGLSYKIGAICFLFTSAMTPLLTREFAVAFSEQNLDKMRSLFQRYIPLLYTIAAFFAVFVAVQADKVSLILGGSEFQQASLAIAVMAFYPIYQTYGQLSGSVFLATGQTKLYRNIGLLIIPISLIVSLWLVGPQTWFGLELGALGLAIKTIATAFIGVNLQLWFNARFLRLSFWKFLGHQIYSVALLIVVAWLSASAIDPIVKGTLLAFLISGFVYTLGCVGVLFLFPAVFAVSRTDLVKQWEWLKSLLKNRA